MAYYRLEHPAYKRFIRHYTSICTNAVISGGSVDFRRVDLDRFQIDRCVELAIERFRQFEQIASTDLIDLARAVAIIGDRRFSNQDELTPLFRATLDAARLSKDSASERFALNQLGKAQNSFDGDMREALGCYKLLYNLSISAHDSQGVADALLGLGAVTSATKEHPDQSPQYFRQLQVFAREVDNAQWETKAVIGLAMRYHSLNWQNEAIKLMETISDDELGDPDLGFAIGLLFEQAGNSNKAISIYEGFLHYAKKNNDEDQIKTLCMMLGSATFRVRNYEKSVEYLRESIKIRPRNRNLENEIPAYRLLGDASIALKRNSDAINAFTNAIAIIQKEGKLDQLPGAWTSLATAQEKENLFDKAIESYHQAITVSRQLKSLESEWKSLTNLGNLYAVIGSWHLAKESFAKAMSLIGNTEDLAAIESLLVSQGNASRICGQLDYAEDSYKQMLAVAEAAMNTNGIFQACFLLGDVFIERGSFHEALPFFGRAEELANAFADQDVVGKVDEKLSILRKQLGEQPNKIGEYEQMAIAAEIAKNLDTATSLWQMLGSWAYYIGNFQDSIRCFDKCLEIAEQLDDHELLVANYLSKARAYLAVEDSCNVRHIEMRLNELLDAHFPWRKDQNLFRLFHPAFPDDLEVIVHDGNPRHTGTPYELMWVRVNEKHSEEIYIGTILNEPFHLKSVQAGDRILFKYAQGLTNPFKVSQQYLDERTDWQIEPCRFCGFDELFDPPSVILARRFRTTDGEIMSGFTSFCPVCHGFQMVKHMGEGVTATHIHNSVNTVNELQNTDQSTESPATLSTATSRPRRNAVLYNEQQNKHNEGDFSPFSAVQETLRAKYGDIEPQTYVVEGKTGLDYVIYAYPVGDPPFEWHLVTDSIYAWMPKIEEDPNLAMWLGMRIEHTMHLPYRPTWNWNNSDINGSTRVPDWSIQLLFKFARIHSEKILVPKLTYGLELIQPFSTNKGELPQAVLFVDDEVLKPLPDTGISRFINVVGIFHEDELAQVRSWDSVGFAHILHKVSPSGMTDSERPSLMTNVKLADEISTSWSRQGCLHASLVFPDAILSISESSLNSAKVLLYLTTRAAKELGVVLQNRLGFHRSFLMQCFGGQIKFLAGSETQCSLGAKGQFEIILSTSAMNKLAKDLQNSIKGRHLNIPDLPAFKVLIEASLSSRDYRVAETFER